MSTIKNLGILGGCLAVLWAAAAATGQEGGEILWSFSTFGGDDYFHEPSDIEVDREMGLIYVADSGNRRVLVFDYDGDLIRVTGKQGQGPGEFSKPTGLFVFGDSSLAVVDYDQHRIQIFDESGTLIRTVKTKEVRVADLVEYRGEFYTIPSFGTSGFGLNMGSKEKSQPLVNVLDSEGDKVREFTVGDFPETHPFVRAIKHRVCLALSPEEKLYLPYFAMNLIQVFNLQGEKIGEFERPLPFKAMTPELVEQKNTKTGIIQMRASLDMVTKAGRFGPDGLLYLLTYTSSLSENLRRRKDADDWPEQPMRIDVIDPATRKIVRRLDCDAGVYAFGLLGDDRIVTIFEDAEGELVFKCVQY